MNRRDSVASDERAGWGWLRCVGRWGLAGKSTGLAVAVAVAWALASPVAWGLDHWAGLTASAAAAGLCFFGAQGALVWSWWFRGPKYLLLSSLGGMLPRMVVPLAGALVLQISVDPLAKAGVLLYLLYFYPITLSVETAMSLPAVLPPGGREGI